jgi:hypothetical protein
MDHFKFLKPIRGLYLMPHTHQDDAYGHGDIFFWLMPLSIDGIAWSEKRDENKQASINRWEIGFIPFFRTNVMHTRGIAKKDIPMSMHRVILKI